MNLNLAESSSKNSPFAMSCYYDTEIENTCIAYPAFTFTSRDWQICDLHCLELNLHSK